MYIIINYKFYIIYKHLNNFGMKIKLIIRFCILYLLSYLLYLLQILIWKEVLVQLVILLMKKDLH